MLIMTCLLLACQNQSTMPSSLDIQGHRGCRGLMPENTIPGFIHAIDIGVNTLEMDVCISQDKHVVLSHEPFFDHKIATAPDGTEINESNEKEHNLYALDYEEIKKYDVGLKQHPWFEAQRKIPTYKPRLSSLIDTVQAYLKQNNLPQVQYSIEMKYKEKMANLFHPERKEFVELTLACIKAKGIEEHVILQCFDAQTLNILHQLDPSIQTAYLIENKKTTEENMALLDFIPTIYSPDFDLVDKKLVEYCHSKRMKLIPWTINEVEDINRMISLNVDGIISDYPDRVINIAKKGLDQ